jgi:integrase/recombinase XerD
MIAAKKEGEWEGDRISISFPYNSNGIAKIKPVEGCRWHPEKRCGSVPYSEGVVKRIVSLFDGVKVEVGKI